jgi:hypothetical protein
LPKVGTEANNVTDKSSGEHSMHKPKSRRRWLGACLLPLIALSPSFGQAKKEKERPKIEGRLIVEDRAELFSPEGVKRAKAILGEIKDTTHREMSLVTFRVLPEAKKREYDKLDSPASRRRLFSDWARDEARDQKARGVFVLVCRSPGHIEILVDKAIRDKGFSARDEERVVAFLLEKFKDAKDKPEDEQTAIRDKGLLNAAEYVRDAYKKMVR